MSKIAVGVMLIGGVLVGNHYLNKYYSSFEENNPKLEELKAKLALLEPSFAKVKMREGTSSYTQGGSYITLKLRDSEGQYFDDNTLFFAVLHELTHTLVRCGGGDHTGGHCSTFVTTFHDLLRKASDQGLYDEVLGIDKEYE